MMTLHVKLIFVLNAILETIQNVILNARLFIHIGTLCKEGYSLSSNQKTCVLNCEVNEFPQFTKDSTTNLPNGGNCASCDASCYTCNALGISGCTSCKNG